MYPEHPVLSTVQQIGSVGIADPHLSHDAHADAGQRVLPSAQHDLDRVPGDIRLSIMEIRPIDINRIIENQLDLEDDDVT